MTSGVGEAGRRAGPVPLIIPAVLVAATATAILSTDLYAPSLPHLPEYFGTSAETVQLTMSLNLVGYGFAQLIHGPLSDRFGRRPVLLAGMAGFALFSLACALAQSIDMLITARLLQGVMACSQSVIALAVIRDLYDEKSSVKVLAAYGMAVALAPAVGPIIGGYVHVLAGWRANFLLLTGLVIAVTALIWRFLPETTVPDPHAIRPWRLLPGYAALLRQRRFMAYALICAAPMGALFGFITAGPFVLIDQFGVPTQNYGYYQAAFVLAYFLGSLTANRAASRFGIETILRTGLAIGAAGGGSLPGLLLAGLAGPLAVTFAMSVFAFGLGLSFATAPVRAIDAATGGRGSVAASLGALEIGGAALGAFAVGALHNDTPWPLALTVAGFALGAAAVYLVARPWR
ncbi:MAG: multidrug effflux MFS transporter [Minwuiales bacterium]|nr:multidrug effflux MFS transporter [Minwuiales bacterium]